MSTACTCFAHVKFLRFSADRLTAFALKFRLICAPVRIYKNTTFNRKGKVFWIIFLLASNGRTRYHKRKSICFRRIGVYGDKGEEGRPASGAVRRMGSRVFGQWILADKGDLAGQAAAGNL